MNMDKSLFLELIILSKNDCISAAVGCDDSEDAITEEKKGVINGKREGRRFEDENFAC